MSDQTEPFDIDQKRLGQTSGSKNRIFLGAVTSNVWKKKTLNTSFEVLGN